MNTTNTTSVHITMFPFLAFGHITPFLNLARKLTAYDPKLRITILSAPSNIPRITSLLSSSSSNILIHPLPLPPISGLPIGIESTADLSPANAELLKLAVDATQPQLHSLLQITKPDFIVFDFAMPWLPSLALPLGVNTIFFSVFSAISTAYLTSPSRRPTTLKTPPPSFPSTSSLSGGVPTFQADNFAYIFKKFNASPTVYDRVVTCMTASTAILAKTCAEMEGQYITYVEEQYKKPILLAGPMIPEPPSGELDEKWGKWLGAFDDSSVIFCSFGSETFLKKQDLEELLLGLEMTEKPFLAVINHIGDESDFKKSKLPEGFEERVKERGAVHCGWVQQQLILNHSSVGCFLNHAGFSSVIEGVVAGCRLVFLPQRGDQYLNSALFAGDLGIGVEVGREDGDGRFGREGICEAVRKAVEDEGVGRKWGKWREVLMDGEVEERCIKELVGRLRVMAGGA